MMGARALIFLLITVIAAGVCAYDQHLTARGEISPVARLIDFTGLAQVPFFADQKERRVVRIYQTRQQDHLERLRDAHLAIQAQRQQVIAQRQAILNQLVRLNDTLRDQAQAYGQMITEERQRFLNEFPEFRQLRVPGQPLPAEGEAGTVSLDQFVAGVLEEDLGAGADLARVTPSLERFFSTQPDRLAAVCGTQELRDCLDQHPQQARELLMQLTTAMVQWSEEDQQALTRVLERLSREARAFDQNHLSSDDRLLDINAGLEQEFQAVTQQLVAVTESGVQALLAEYASLNQEAQMLLDNLELNVQRLEASRLELSRLEAGGGAADLIPGGAAALREQQGVLGQIRENGDQYQQLLSQEWSANDFFVAGLRDVWQSYRQTQSGRYQQAAQKQTARTAAVAARPEASRIGNPVVPAKGRSVEEVLRDAAPASLHGRGPTADQVEDQMQRLRDRARDQGFY